MDYEDHRGRIRSISSTVIGYSRLRRAPRFVSRPTERLLDVGLALQSALRLPWRPRRLASLLSDQARVKSLDCGRSAGALTGLQASAKPKARRGRSTGHGSSSHRVIQPECLGLPDRAARQPVKRGRIGCGNQRRHCVRLCIACEPPCCGY